MSNLISIENSFLNKMLLAIRKPSLVLEHILTSHDFERSRITRIKVAKERFSESLATFLDVNVNEIRGYFDSLLGTDLIRILVLRGLKDAKATILISEGALLYVVCRVVKPEVVVETGVGAGLSTAFILKCLTDIGKGHLISIDLPDHHILEGREIGYLIPPELRRRWKLYKGDSKVLLPQLLAEAGVVDMSFHDACASYEHQMFEYSNVWRYLRRGGILVSDNIDLSRAFSDFHRKTACPALVVNGKFGLLLKR
jgi:predicted O-methyltransferase YrrM